MKVRQDNYLRFNENISFYYILCNVLIKVFESKVIDCCCVVALFVQARNFQQELFSLVVRKLSETLSYLQLEYSLDTAQSLKKLDITIKCNHSVVVWLYKQELDLLIRLGEQIFPVTLRKNNIFQAHACHK